MGSIAKVERRGHAARGQRDRPGDGDEIGNEIGGVVVEGWALLLGAGVLVGIAIALDSPVGRVLNGVGGVTWLAGAVLLIREARRFGVDQRTWLMLSATVVALSWLSSPRDLVAATLGFAAGGAGLAVVARSRSARFAVVGLVPALWLPTHLAMAAGKAVSRVLGDQPAAIRTDPPPTAALVPLAMVVAALAGGLLARTMAYRRHRSTGHR